MGRCPSLIPRKTRGFIVRKPFANTGRSTVANPSLIGGCCRSLFRPIYHCSVVVIGRCSPHRFKRALCLFRVCYRPRSGCNYQTGPPSVSRLFVLALRPSKWSEIVPFGIGRFKGFLRVLIAGGCSIVLRETTRVWAVSSPQAWRYVAGRPLAVEVDGSGPQVGRSARPFFGRRRRAFYLETSTLFPDGKGKKKSKIYWGVASATTPHISFCKGYRRYKGKRGC